MQEFPPSPTSENNIWPWSSPSIPAPENLRDVAYPKISVVTPSYNQSQFLEETIRSVLLQGYPNLEYFIMDGGSDDGSIDIIKKYEPWLTYWESKPDRGQSHAINKGFQRAGGEILAWLNSDDIYLPNALFKVAREYNENTQGVLFIGSCDLKDAVEVKTKSATELDMRAEALIRGGEIPGQPSVFISRNAYKKVGELREDLYYVMDWEYWLRISLEFSEKDIILFKDTLSVFRKWSGGKTRAGAGLDLVERRQMYKELFMLPTLSRLHPSIRRNAFASTYWKQARVYLEIRAIFRAVLSFWRSFILYPKSYNPVSFIVKNADLILPAWSRRILKKLPYFK